MNASLDDHVTSTPENATAILLAGGSSKRFGTDNKLLAEFNGEPLIIHALDNIANSNVQHVIIVLGHDASELKLVCKKQLKKYTNKDALSAKFTLNPDFDSGISTSLRTGVSALLGQRFECAATYPRPALICLADMPLVKSTTINALVDAMNKSTSNDIVNPEYIPASAFIPSMNGRRGNPVLLMPKLFDLLLSLSGDFGARHLLKDNPNSVKEVSVDDSGIFLDFDTSEQLQT